jgi:hypothetical protein
MGKPCDQKMLFPNEKMASEYAVSYNKDPLVKIPLTYYECIMHSGWHVATKRANDSNWYRRLQDILDRIASKQNN